MTKGCRLRYKSYPQNVDLGRGETTRTYDLDPGLSLPVRHWVLRHRLWRCLDPHHRACLPDHVHGTQPVPGSTHHRTCRCWQDWNHQSEWCFLFFVFQCGLREDGVHRGVSLMVRFLVHTMFPPHLKMVTICYLGLCWAHFYNWCSPIWDVNEMWWVLTVIVIRKR